MTVTTTTSVDLSNVPVLNALSTPLKGTRKRTPAQTNHTTHLHETYHTMLIQRAENLRDCATKYQHAGNLEQTLAVYLDLCLTLQHLESAPGKPNTPTMKKNTRSELRRVYTILEQLHQQVQAKKTYYHGCLESDDEEEDEDTEAGFISTSVQTSSNTKTRSRTKLDCKGVVPIDASKSSVTLASIVGNDHIKQDIINGIVNPFKQPLLFKVRRSFLFYGPPGTGKTLFAKAAAHSLAHMAPNLHVLFFAPTTDRLKDKYVGGTERKITTYFRCVQQQAEEHTASSGTPTMGVIFIDEIDSLARSRDTDDTSGTTSNTTNTLLQMMDGFTALPNVIVMAATNYPWQLDSAILSRFQEKIYVRLPDLGTVQSLLRHYLKQFYCQTLGIDESSDVFAAKNTGVDPNVARFEIMSKLFGVSDDKLLVIARKMCQPLTYSPSNIRDVCHQALRKSARQAHVNGVFHEIKIQTSSPAFLRCTKIEQDLLQRMNHKYASAVTYDTLVKGFPGIVNKTPALNVNNASTYSQIPTDMHSSTHQNRSLQSAIRPDKLTVNGVVYTYCSLWEHSDSTRENTSVQHVVRMLQHIQGVHVYVSSSSSHGSPSTTNEKQQPYQHLDYAVFRTFHVQYGPCDVHVLQVCATGTLDRSVIQAMERYENSNVLDLQRYIGKLFGVSPTKWLVEGIHTMCFRDVTFANNIPSTHPSGPLSNNSSVPDNQPSASPPTNGAQELRTMRGSENRTGPEPSSDHSWSWWQFAATNKYTVSSERLTTTELASATRPLDLHSFEWQTNSGMFRFICWLLGYSTSRTLPEKAKKISVDRDIDIRLHVGTEENSHHPKRDVRMQNIEQNMFSLHVDLDCFLDAMNGEENVDAVLPTSDEKEVRRFDTYWKDGKVNGV